MESLASVTGHIREPQLPVIGRYGDQYDENHGRPSDTPEFDMDNLNRKFSSLTDPSEGRSWLLDNAEQFRSDTLSDIRYGLSKAGTVIKIVSALLSLFGGSEHIDKFFRRHFRIKLSLDTRSVKYFEKVSKYK